MRRATHRKRWLRAAAVAAIALALGAGVAAVWYARPRTPSDVLSRAAAAYNEGRWATAAELARKVLVTSKEDPAALRLLARSSVRLGRDSTAVSIYRNRLDDKSVEAEDYFLLGLALERTGQAEPASRAWEKVLESGQVSPRSLEELARLLIQSRRWDQAIAATERLGLEPGWEARGSMMLGTVRAELNNVPGAAASFRRALEFDPAEVENSHEPSHLRKLIARTFLRLGSPDEAETTLQPILKGGPDSEAAWLESRVYLQKGNKARALSALNQSGAYRAANPLEPEPAPFVGEARCEKCHAAIFRDSLASRHTQSYYRGTQLLALPRSDRPLPDPDNPEVTHTIRSRDGALREEIKVGSTVLDALVEYAFGTPDRYLTFVSRDARGGYHVARLSYHDTPEGKGWDRSVLDETHPTPARAAEFHGAPISARDGLAKCLYCHVTNPRTGNEVIGPEAADRGIGCERCHGPGGHHIAALQAGFPDQAIANPAGASPAVVAGKQCNDCHILGGKFPDADPEDPRWIRSQGVGWALSRCNTLSAGAFGCVTCHDPHKSARATTVAQYEAQCLTCHERSALGGRREQRASGARAPARLPSRSCPVNASQGCIKCHMPKVRIDSLHLDLTDHYIRVHR
jgi:predicted CXXCH cytochrome family protein